MLPVALTCPLWWVARWASRLLAGLALTAGLSVGVAGTADANAAAADLVPAGVSVAPGACADGATPTDGLAIETAPSVRMTPDQASSYCGVAVPPAGGVPHGAAEPAPVTGAEARSLSGRFVTAADPRAPPLG